KAPHHRRPWVSRGRLGAGAGNDGHDPPPAEGGGMKILVADDDKTRREGLAALLRQDGHAIVTAADGGEALRTVERESFDVGLLDLRMPKATGLEVLHRLRVVRPETAVVMITGEGTIDAAV